VSYSPFAWLKFFHSKLRAVSVAVAQLFLVRPMRVFVAIVAAMLFGAMVVGAHDKPRYFHGWYRGYLEEYAASSLPENADQSVAVIGLVKTPNTLIPPENGLTVSKAIDRAGGFAPFADHAHVGIFSSDEGLFLMTNLYQVKEGKAPDLILLKGDIVIFAGRLM
jgi:hypothetical protein